MARTDATSIRLDSGTLDRIKALQPSLSVVGHAATLSDAHRAVVLTGLDALEKQAAEKGREEK